MAAVRCVIGKVPVCVLTPPYAVLCRLVGELPAHRSTACSSIASGGIACLILLVQHMCSSNVANHVASYGDPRHDGTRMQRTRPY